MMLCCVIAGALVAIVAAKLTRVPILGAYFRARENARSDASAWRLNPLKTDSQVDNN